MNYAGATKPGRSPFGTSIFQQIEEEGLGREWVGVTGNDWMQSPRGGHCCVGYT